MTPLLSDLHARIQNSKEECSLLVRTDIAYLIQHKLTFKVECSRSAAIPFRRPTQGLINPTTGLEISYRAPSDAF